MNRCMREEFSKCLKGNRELKGEPSPPGKWVPPGVLKNGTRCLHDDER